MTVAELIEKLQGYDGAMLVFLDSDQGTYCAEDAVMHDEEWSKAIYSDGDQWTRVVTGREVIKQTVVVIV